MQCWPLKFFLGLLLWFIRKMRLNLHYFLKCQLLQEVHSSKNLKMQKWHCLVISIFHIDIFIRNRIQKTYWLTLIVHNLNQEIVLSTKVKNRSSLRSRIFWLEKTTNSKKSQFFNELKFQYILSLHPRELATCRFFTGVVASEWTLRYVLSEKKAMAWQQHSFESCGHDIRDRVSVYQCISYLDFRQELNLP